MQKESGTSRMMNQFELNKNNSPKITVITVVYNCVNTIEETIKSVINQSYRNVEYIIVDGQSNDGTVEILKKYDENINIWISEPDNGIYDAMNKGILLASGEWINFMNAGDRYCSDNVLTELFFYHYSYDRSDVIYGNSFLQRNDNSQLRIAADKPISELWKGPVFRHGAMFTKTTLHKKYLFKLDHKYKVCADFDFIYLLHIMGYQMKYINVDILVYEEEGVSNNPFKNLKYNRMILLAYQHTIYQNIVSFFRLILLSIYFIIQKIRLRFLGSAHNSL